MHGNLKAISIGWLVYALGNVSYYVIINAVATTPSYLNYMLYFMAFIGGLITGRLSIRKPVLCLFIVGVLMGLTAGVINYLYWLLGFPADFGGFKGFQIVITFSIPAFILLSLFGGALGSEDEEQQTLNTYEAPGSQQAMKGDTDIASSVQSIIRFHKLSAFQFKDRFCPKHISSVIGSAVTGAVALESIQALLIPAHS